jgi:8-oxo-dGTP pyrophosphatase MutT (NUDIX family)
MARVKVIVQKQLGRILAIKNTRNREYYQLPEGDINEGEDLREAAARVLREQTGLTAGDMAWLYEGEDEGVPTTTFDAEWKNRKGIIEGCKYVGPVHLTQGPGGAYNYEVFQLLGIDFTNIIDDVMDA